MRWHNRNGKELVIILRDELSKEDVRVGTLEGFVNRLVFLELITIYERDALQNFINQDAQGRFIKAVNWCIRHIFRRNRKIEPFKKGDKVSMIKWANRAIKELK